jgi:response regulator NasT
LLVDDDRLVLSTLCSGLLDAGYEVHSAESTEEAEMLLAGGMRPDLAILDIRMSGQDGLYLASRLRELDHIPFLMLSAYSEQGMVDQATRYGALGYLVKPLDPPRLVPAIEAALSRASELQGLRDTRGQLQAALDAERDISVAIGITMVRQQISRQQAFELLRKTARSQRRKLAELANEIICDK